MSLDNRRSEVTDGAFLGGSRPESLEETPAGPADVAPDVAERNAAAIAAATDFGAALGDGADALADLSPELIDYAAHDRSATAVSEESASGQRGDHDVERDISPRGGDSSPDVAT